MIFRYIWATEIRGLNGWGRNWNHVCVLLWLKKDLLSLHVSKSAPHKGTMKTEPLFAAENSNDTKDQLQYLPSKILHGAVAGEVPFSGSLKINSYTISLFVRTCVFSVQLIFDFISFIERAWFSFILTLEGREAEGRKASVWDSGFVTYWFCAWVPSLSPLSSPENRETLLAS